MTDPKPDLVKMAREALCEESAHKIYAGLTGNQILLLRALANAVIDQLAPPPVKVAAWVVVDKNGDFVDLFRSEQRAREMSDKWNAAPNFWPYGPYRVIYVTGEEGKGPE